MLGEMGSKISSFLLLQCWILLLLSLGVFSDASEVAVKLLETPRAFSSRNFAAFSFQVLVGGNGSICSECSTNCKLDQGKFSACEGGKISYARLLDGNHSFEVCTTKGSCASYNWTVDMVKPTAQITAAASFTNASRVPVNISFSERCSGGGGFRCSSVNACNLLVYGDGEVMPDTLRVIEPNLKYSLVVSVSERVRYGRLILVMDKNVCTDSAGNQFTRSENSSLFIHFDRRSVFVNMRTHIPEKLLQINSATRTILATNKNKFLKIYLYFTQPVMNSSAEILNAIDLTQGSLVPINGSSRGQRRFGYQFTNITDMAIVSVSLQSNMVISRQGTPVASVPPVTFLYDSERPAVKLSTSKMRTKENSVFVLIKFIKPVLGFNSTHVSISGGHLQSFQEVSRRSYTARVRADSDTISISIPENITADVSGNGNRASNTLQVRHYSVPVESLVLSSFVTGAFGLTALVSGFLTVSTTSLLSAGAFSKPNSILCADPSRILFRIASHIQVFALSRWLSVTLPVEYYELTRGLQWSIPYFNLPWEQESVQSVMVSSNSPKDRLFHVPEAHDSIFFQGLQPEAANVDPRAKVFGLPLNPMEYASYFESQIIMPEAEYIFDPQNSNGWRDFNRSMFWLAVIGGSLIFLHALLVMILKFRKQNKEKQSYGALIFPRLEIFLLVLAIPCFCEASAALIKGGTSSGMIVGVLILSLVAFMLLCLLIFLSFGITLGKLLQYKEVHTEGQQFHWYQEIIRVTLGPGKRGQWTWKNQRRSMYLTILGPLFEDLRGPPKYMLTQIAGARSNKSGDRIIASDDETEDAEAPFIQKLFGILRIYYTLIECVKRVILGIVGGAYNETWSSRTPTIALLSITSFQLFFMVLKKPFIKKRVQFVEIISVTCELTIFAFCFVLLDREFSAVDERKLGITMVVVLLLAFVVQVISAWYALYRQIKQLDPITNSFFRGLETASIGFVLFLCPHALVKNLKSRFPMNNPGETSGTTSAERNQSTGSRSSGDKPWLRQIRELARSSFSKEGSKGSSSNDPSTSKSRWSGYFKKRSGSSSASTSTDFKTKPNRLYKELEDIFASK